MGRHLLPKESRRAVRRGKGRQPAGPEGEFAVDKGEQIQYFGNVKGKGEAMNGVRIVASLCLMAALAGGSVARGDVYRAVTVKKLVVFYTGEEGKPNVTRVAGPVPEQKNQDLRASLG